MGSIRNRHRSLRALLCTSLCKNHRKLIIIASRKHSSNRTNIKLMLLLQLRAPNDKLIYLHMERFTTLVKYFVRKLSPEFFLSF